MVDAPAGDAVCVGSAGRPCVDPYVLGLPLGVRLPFNPFVFPLVLPLPLGKDETLPFPFPGPLDPIVALPLPSR